MAFTTVTVTCDYDLADGLDPTGTVSFTPTTPMVNGHTVVAAKVTHRLDVDGVLSVALAANTDPATLPTGAAYLVEESIAGAVRRYYVTVPHDQGSSIVLSSLASVGVAPALSFPATTATGKDAVPVVNVLDHGMTGDAKTVNGASVSNGATSFTLSGASLSGTDIGKTIVLAGAGPALLTGAPTISAATPSTTGGALAAATYSFIVTAFCGQGESAGATATTAATTGTTGSVALTWTMTTTTNVTGWRVYAGPSGSEILVATLETPAARTYTYTGQSGRDLPNTFIRPPTVNCSPSNLVTTITSVSGGTIGIADAAAATVQASRTVTVNSGRTVTDGVANSGSTTVTSATGAFSALDIGSRISVAGAGSSGATLTATITAVASATSITLGVAATTTVSGATATIRNCILTATSGTFTATDQDKTLAISGASALFGSFRVYRVLSSTQVLIEGIPDTVLSGTSVTVPAGAAVWGTNNTAGLANVKAAVNDNAQRASGSPYFSGYGLGTRVHFPRGDYLIVGDNPLLPSPTSPTARTVRGMRFSGESRDATNLIYAGTATGSPGGKLFRINNNYMQSAWSDMTFTSLDRTAWWLHSSSDGAAQNNTYDRCGWFGRWYRGIGLDPVSDPDTNSEHTFTHCNIRGSLETYFLDIGLSTLTTGSVVAQEDQFLNYWFNQVQFEVQYGGAIRANMGGDISITDGDWFCTAPQGGTLVDLRNLSHGGAVRRFSWRGTRLEPQRSYYCRMLWSEWSSGNVLIDNLDTASTFGIYDAREQIMFDFLFNDVEGPQVVIRNTDLAGRARFLYGTNSRGYRRRALVENCTIKQWSEGHEYIVNTVYAGSGAQLSNAVPVEFRHSRGNRAGTGSAYVTDHLLGGDTTGGGVPVQRRTAYLQNISGGIHPNTPAGADLTLPRGAIITAVRLWMPASAVASTSTTWNVKLQTTEGTPKVLCQADAGATITLTTGFNAYVTEWGDLVGPGQVGTNLLPFYTGTGTGSDTLRHLQLVTNSGFDQTSALSFCVVDYIA